MTWTLWRVRECDRNIFVTLNTRVTDVSKRSCEMITLLLRVTAHQTWIINLRFGNVRELIRPKNAEFRKGTALRSLFLIRRDSSIRNLKFQFLPHKKQDNSVGIATDYGLDGPGIEFRWGRDFSHKSRPAMGPTKPPAQRVPGLSRGLSNRGVVLTTRPP
jgi:hypothetical protein